MHLLRLTRLRHFCAVAEHGSVNVAAKQLHISQPALTRSIRKIEEEVGEPVFERGATGMRLTRTGAALLPHAQAILAEADRAIEQYRNLKGARRTLLKVGISANFGTFLVPDVLQRFFHDDPASQVSVLTGTADQLVAQLLATQIDVAVLNGWGGSMDVTRGRSPDLLCESLLTLPAGPYAPAGHPAAARGHATLEELQREPWIVPHGLNLNYVFDGRFTARGLEPPAHPLVTSHLELLMASVLRLGALTIVPRHVAAREVEAGRLVPIACPDLYLDYEVDLVLRRRGSRSAAMASFAKLLREACAQLRDKGPAAAERQPLRLLPSA